MQTGALRRSLNLFQIRDYHARENWLGKLQDGLHEFQEFHQ